MADRFDALEALLSAELRRDDIALDHRLELSRELATVLCDTERTEAAFALLSETAAGAAEGRRAALEDVLALARRVGDVRRQIDALVRLVDVETDAFMRLTFLSDLARLLSESGDQDGAALRWSQVLGIDPKDREAVAGLERDAERRGDFHRLVELYEQRSRTVANADEARSIRLRCAELLETKLGRPDEARAMLEALLAETGDHIDTLTRLAGVNERLGAKLRAAPLWLRASAVPKDCGSAGELARRAANAYLEGGDVESARRVLEELSKYPRTASLMALRVDIERRSENPRGLSEALEELSLVSMEPPAARAALLMEAASASLASGHLEHALGQAQRAARVSHESAEPQLFARLLEYRTRGAGKPEDAEATLSELSRIREPLSAAQAELLSFLRAEALDMAFGPGRGLGVLSDAHDLHGPLPLIALGLADSARGQRRAGALAATFRRRARGRSAHAQAPRRSRALRGPGRRARGRARSRARVPGRRGRAAREPRAGTRVTSGAPRIARAHQRSSPLHDRHPCAGAGQPASDESTAGGRARHHHARRGRQDRHGGHCSRRTSTRR